MKAILSSTTVVFLCLAAVALGYQQTIPGLNGWATRSSIQRGFKGQALLIPAQNPLIQYCVSDPSLVAAPITSERQDDKRSRNDEVVTFIRMAHLSESGSDFKYMKTSDKIRILDEIQKLFEMNIFGLSDKVNMLWTAVQLEVDSNSYNIKNWYETVLTSIMHSFNVITGEELNKLNLSPRGTKNFLITLGKFNKLPYSKFSTAAKKHITHLFEKSVSHPECSVAEYGQLCKSITKLGMSFPSSSRYHFLKFFNQSEFRNTANPTVIGRHIEDILSGLKIAQNSWIRIDISIRDRLLDGLMTQLDDKQKKESIDPSRLSAILNHLGDLRCMWSSCFPSSKRERILTALESALVKMNFHDFSSTMYALGQSEIIWNRLRESLKTTIIYRLTDFTYFDTYDRICVLVGLNNMRARLTTLPNSVAFKITSGLSFADNCTASEFTRLVSALGSLVRNRPPRLNTEVLAKFVRRFLELIPVFNHHEFADSLNGMSKIGLFAFPRGHMTRLEQSSSEELRQLPEWLCGNISRVFTPATPGEHSFMHSLTIRDLDRVVDALSELRFLWFSRDSNRVPLKWDESEIIENDSLDQSGDEVSIDQVGDQLEIEYGGELDTSNSSKSIAEKYFVSEAVSSNMISLVHTKSLSWSGPHTASILFNIAKMKGVKHRFNQTQLDYLICNIFACDKLSVVDLQHALWALGRIGIRWNELLALYPNLPEIINSTTSEAFSWNKTTVTNYYANRNHPPLDRKVATGMLLAFGYLGCNYSAIEPTLRGKLMMMLLDSMDGSKNKKDVTFMMSALDRVNATFDELDLPIQQQIYKSIKSVIPLEKSRQVLGITTPLLRGMKKKLSGTPREIREVLLAAVQAVKGRWSQSVQSSFVRSLAASGEQWQLLDTESRDTITKIISDCLLEKQLSNFTVGSFTPPSIESISNRIMHALEKLGIVWGDFQLAGEAKLILMRQLAHRNDTEVNIVQKLQLLKNMQADLSLESEECLKCVVESVLTALPTLNEVERGRCQQLCTELGIGSHVQ